MRLEGGAASEGAVGSGDGQVMMRCAPPPLLASLYARLFKGHLVKRARHPTANFVVQALMAAASSADQVRATEDLLPRAWDTYLNVVLSHLSPYWATWTGGVHGR